MVNLLLISLLISSFINFIKGNKVFDTLNCGIWAFLGKNPKDFDVDKFNILGIFNDPRGGDAAGFLSGNQLVHKKDSKYVELIQNSIISKPRKHPVVLGHSRKASSGGKEIQYTQPFCIKTSSGIEGAAIHNGTLYNEHVLAAKYNVPDELNYSKDIKYAPNDSQILAYILIHLKEFEVLRQYQGAAAIIWENREENKAYIFKGASERYYNGNIEEERPLHMYKNKKGIWVSSLFEPLMAIADDTEPDIEEVKDNTILVVSEGKVVEEIPIDRSKSDQRRVYTSNAELCYDYWPDYGYGYKEDYLKSKKESKRSRKRKKDKNKHNQNNTISNNNSNNNAIPLPGQGQATILQQYKAEETENCRENVIDYAQGRYWFNDELATGQHWLDEIGYKSDHTDKNAILFYFVEGIMITNHKDHVTVHQSYQEANSLVKQIRKGKYRPMGLSKGAPKDAMVVRALLPFSKYPISNLEDVTRLTWEHDEVAGQAMPFTGRCYPLYNRNKYVFVRGNITEIEDLQVYRKPIKDHEEDTVDVLPDFRLNSYYSLIKDPEYIVQVINVEKEHALNVEGDLVHLDGRDKWKEVTLEDWLTLKEAMAHILDREHPEDDIDGSISQTEEENDGVRTINLRDFTNNDIDEDEEAQYAVEERSMREFAENQEAYVNDILSDMVAEKLDRICKILDEVDVDIDGSDSCPSAILAKDLSEELRGKIRESEFNKY